MDVAIKKVSERDGADRFILVKATTREVVTVHDVSEKTLRHFFLERDMSDDLFDDCLEKARAKFDEVAPKVSVPVSDAQETMGDDDLLFELGLGEDE